MSEVEGDRFGWKWVFYRKDVKYLYLVIQNEYHLHHDYLCYKQQSAWISFYATMLPKKLQEPRGKHPLVQAPALQGNVLQNSALRSGVVHAIHPMY